MSTQNNPQIDLKQIDFGHWIWRLIAFVIDSIIIAVITWVLLSVLLISLLFSGGLATFWLAYGYALVFPFILGVIEVLYFVIFEVALGGTIGKRLLGLQVQMTNGSKVTFDKSIIRNISKIYWIFLVLDWLIGIITPGADRRQKYTDRIAGTTVVQGKQTLLAGPAPAPSS